MKKIFMTIKVYTDGSCHGNGQKNAKCGIGVYFGPNDLRNISQSIDGRQTNNTAELTALIKAIEKLDKEINLGYKITIYTDSIYVIRCCTTYGEKLNNKGWNNKLIPNFELVKQAYLLYSKLQNVKLKHVLAHTGKSDKHSIGNRQADLLANQAITQISTVV